MKFNLEPVSNSLCEEIFPLLEKHYDEVAHFKQIPLSPDFKQYKKLDEMGVLRCYTARDETGGIVGYAIFMVKHNIHYSTSLQAVQDVIFIHPERRGFGIKFIKWCDEMLKADGVEAVYHHVKREHPALGVILSRIGYKEIDHIYGRAL